MRQERFESPPKVRVATAGVGEEFGTFRPVTRAQGIVELRDLLRAFWGHHHFSDPRQVNGCCPMRMIFVHQGVLQPPIPPTLSER